MNANQIKALIGRKLAGEFESSKASVLDELLREIEAEEKASGLIPQWKHDCDECKFLGRHEGRDLYYCVSGSASPLGSVLARSGSSPDEYSSVPLQIAETMAEGPLYEASRRANALREGGR
jgi:hypothetical protein